jgi:hypothetical protein
LLRYIKQAAIYVQQHPILGYAIVIEALGEVGFFNSLKHGLGSLLENLVVLIVKKMRMKIEN